MLPCKLAWLSGLAVIFIGVSVRAQKLTAVKDKVSVNVRQDVSLNWTLQINSGGKPFILCGTSTDGLDEPLRIKDTLFFKREDQDKPRPYDGMPSKFSGRVNMIWQRQTISLSIQRVDLSDEGFYMCEVSTLFVTDREKIFLQVTDPPQILTVLPKEIKENERENLQLTCETAGRPKPRVTWKRGDTVLNQTRWISTLNFSPLTYKDHGEYKCIAENAGGREDKTVRINVQYSPKETNITTDAPSDTVSDGSRISITCKAYGNPKPMYQFFIHKRPIVDRKAEISGVLSVTAISFRHSGIYSCRAENEIGRGPKKEVTVYVRRKSSYPMKQFFF